MKLPSLKHFYTLSKGSFLRFPLPLISSMVAVAFGIYLVEFGDDIDNFFPYINILLTAALGVPLFFCTSVYFNIEKKSILKKGLLNGVAFLLLIAIYYSLPDSEFTNNTKVPYIKYTIYNCIVHLLVSFVPYWKTKKLNGFWNYNKLLFIRLWASILYSLVLYLGLILALYAIHTLFNIEIHDELYFEIFIFIIGIFNTWFFVSGIPVDLESLENQKTYPKGLKVFTQYLLLPLLILYLLILYVYGFKIILNWDWPNGIVSYLISGVSTLGILAFLLIYPFSNSKENSWIKQFSKAYYYILFPLIIILFFAIGMRINAYGITINRYLIILLGTWLTIVCTYFSIGKTNIKFIPKTLALLLALMSFGPWGMFSVSENSQVSRLKDLLEDSKITTNNKVNREVMWVLDSLPKLHANKYKTNQFLVKDSIHNEIYSIVNYLEEHHGFTKINSIFQQNIDSIITIARFEKKRFNETAIYMRSLGLKKYRIYKNDWSNDSQFTFSKKSKDYTDIKGYDYLVYPNLSTNYNSRSKRYFIKNKEYCIDSLDTFKKEFVFYTENETLVFDLAPTVNNLIKKFGKKSKRQLNDSLMTLYKSTSYQDYKLEIKSIRLKNKNDSIFINSIDTNLFIKEK